MIKGVDYQKHIPSAMRKNRFKVIESNVSSLIVSETVYR
ncbi:hypothetical protein [Enterobacter phage N5822]|nr:hypothetical protein [Enterobacter phage N5822]